MEQTVSRGIDWSAGQEKRESRLEYLWTSRKWDQNTVLAWVLGSLAVALVIFIVYRGAFGNIDTRVERSLVVTLLLIYTVLRFPSGKKKWSDRINWFFAIDLVLILLALATQVYTLWDLFIAETEDLSFHIFSKRIFVDHIVGTIVVAMVMDAVRRSFGWLLVLLTLFFIGYCLFGNYFPGPLRSLPASYSYLMEILYVTNSGVYGMGIQVLLSMVFLYLMFASVLQDTKIGAVFIAGANAVVGRYAGGPAKVAVVSSAGFGTISGSAIANVATTGCITIPMMKSAGYSSTFAAAVEACSSSGGQFTPPIMGASAFLISAFTGIPYIKVCLHCAVPALLYFLGIFAQVHFRAKKQGLMGLPRERIPSLLRVMKEGAHLVLPLAIIIAALALGYSITMVAVWGILSVLMMSFVKKETRLNARSIMVSLENALDKSVGVSWSVILCGVILGALMVTGLAVKLSALIDDFAAGNLVLGLVIGAVVSIILGMGLPTLIVYLMMTLFVIPSLSSMGTPVIAAHLFAFFFGAASMITPPVCQAAWTAAAIAGSPMMRTGLEASKLAFAAYVVPFAFIFHPSLLILGSDVVDIAISLLTAAIAIIAMAAAFEGWLLTRVPVLDRILFLCGGCLLLAPSRLFALIGVGLLLVAVWRQKSRLSLTIKRETG